MDKESRTVVIDGMVFDIKPEKKSRKKMTIYEAKKERKR